MTEQPVLEKEAAPRALRDELRPYVPGRGSVRALCDGLATGSAVLVRRGWDWVTEEDWRTALTRLGCVAGGLYVGVYELHQPGAAPVVPFVGPAGAGAWCVAAWLVAPPARSRRSSTPAAVAEGEFKEGDELEAGEHSPAPELVDVLALVHQVQFDGRGAHLADVLEAGGEELFGAWTVTDLRRLLEAHGIPVDAQLKRRLPGGRQRNRPGVRLADLPPHSGEAPAWGADGAPVETPAEAPVPGPAGTPGEGAAGAPAGAPLPHSPDRP